MSHAVFLQVAQARAIDHQDYGLPFNILKSFLRQKNSAVVQVAQMLLNCGYLAVSM